MKDWGRPDGVPIGRLQEVLGDLGKIAVDSVSDLGVVQHRNMFARRHIGLGGTRHRNNVAARRILN